MLRVHAFRARDRVRVGVGGGGCHGWSREVPDAKPAGRGGGAASGVTAVAGAGAALNKSTHAGRHPGQVRTALLAAAEPGPIPGDPDTFPEPVLNASEF